MTRFCPLSFRLLQARSLAGLLLLLTACGGRTDIEDWNDFGDPFQPGVESGGGLNPVGGGPAVGGAQSSGGAPQTGMGGSGGVFGSGGFAATGGTGGEGATGGSGGTGGAGGADGTGGSGGSVTSVSGDVFVDCETNIENGDGFSWATPLKHPALAFPGREDGDVIYLKAGTCHAWSDPTLPLLTIPDGLSVTLAGGYDGDNLNDQFAHAGGRTFFSGDNDENDVNLPVMSGVTTQFAASRADNNSTILRIGSGADVLVSSLTIEGAFNNTDSASAFGGVSVGGDANFTALSSTIRNCATVYSAALDAETGSSVTLDQVLIEYNDSFGGTGAVSARNASVSAVNGSVFRYNRAVHGGAIWLEGSSLEATDSQFVENQAFAYGGAIDLSDELSSAHLYNNVFEANVANFGGAVSILGGSAFMEVCDFTGNEGAVYGGSIYASAGDLEIVQNTFEGGTATYGGEVSVWNAAVQLLGNLFWGGSAERGGNVYANNCNSLRTSRDLFMLGTARSGGQIYAEGPSMLIEDTVFFGGSAENAGTLFFVPSATGTTALTIRGSSFIGSTATTTSSVFSAMGAPFQIDTSTFVDNGTIGLPLIATFGGPGGNVSRSTFMNNIGEGILHSTGTTVTVTDSYVGNHTSETSGVVFADAGSNLTLQGVTLAENTTSGESTPAITVGSGSELSFNNSVLWSSASAPGPWISVHSNGASATTDSSCGPAALAAFGTNTVLTSSPFVDLGAYFPLLQAPASPCLDQGSATGEDYSALSTVVPFAPDALPVDPGYHYQDTTPLTREFSVTATQATWNIDDPASMTCQLIVPGERVRLGGGESGTYDHSFATGTEFYLICKEETAGNTPIVLSATL